MLIVPPTQLKQHKYVIILAKEKKGKAEHHKLSSAASVPFLSEYSLEIVNEILLLPTLSEL